MDEAEQERGRKAYSAWWRSKLLSAARAGPFPVDQDGRVSTPLAAPVAAATRLRGGNAPSAGCAGGLAAQAIGTARDCGATGTIVVRMDSLTTRPP